MVAAQIHREALAALKLFCDAAKQEAATAELVRRVERFLKRARQGGPTSRSSLDKPILAK